MAKPQVDHQKDLLRPALEAIIDMDHPLTQEIDWGFLDRRFARVRTAGGGHPPLPTRLVAGFLILKHLHDLSDEALCARAGSRTRITSSEHKRSTVIADKDEIIANLS